jgi:acetylornithine deacetylase/succinyl-diaminopimelate desuccinylase-like protein
MTSGLHSLDEQYLWRVFERFVACDSSVRIGENRLDPLDPRVARFARDVAGPVLEELGASVEIDGLNNVIGRFGPSTGNELLLVSYSAIHHGNDMPDPLRGVRVARDGDELWVGLGASQGKGGFAAVCAAIHMLRRQGTELAGALTVAVSSEGSSSHASAKSLYARLAPLLSGAVLTIGTENRVTLGNRGRVDIEIEILGRATHSSAAELGTNPIPIVADVQARVRDLRIDPRPHELLGTRTLVPYKLVCGPVAPHTIPAWCLLVLDRRLLPGDDPDTAVADVAEALADLPVLVTKGPLMLPALVRASDRVVVALQRAAEAELGRRLETFYPAYTFDAGYPCSIGVPTVMFGPSTSDLSGTDVLGVDAVSLSQLRTAAAVYAGAVTANRAASV